MKKIFLILIAVMMSCGALEASQLTSTQKKAKTEIFNALKKYGSNLTDSGDEEIEFQYNRARYKVAVHLLNPQTLYLAMSVTFNLNESYDSELANLAAYYAASDKPVCSFAGYGGLFFSCEMYAKDAKPFIAVMPEMLQALSSSVDSFQGKYDELLKAYLPESSASVSSIANDDNTFIYPKFASNGDSRLFIEKVTLDPNYTILDMVSYNGREYQNCTLDRNSYIMAYGKKYELIKAEGITYSPTYTDYPNYQSGREVSLHFKLYFPPLPKGTHAFDFMERSNDGWQIKGIVLQHGESYAINSPQIETTYHFWECTGIELQNGQTILTKICRPKSNGLYMHSSHDEFIEDAETGRKYYLINSSIGFEGSPQTTHDTLPVTFYEVYPALPPSVKKINIHSGSQYFVEGLQIR